MRKLPVHVQKARGDWAVPSYQEKRYSCAAVSKIHLSCLSNLFVFGFDDKYLYMYYTEGRRRLDSTILPGEKVKKREQDSFILSFQYVRLWV